jgi:hypothetical protein
MIWIPIYMVLALRRVYQQGWILTTMKAGLIAFSYMVLLTFVTTVIALLGLILVR